VRVSGFDVFEQSAEVRRRIGYLPENPPLYSDMTVVPYLRFAGKIHGLGRSEVGAAVDRVIDTCGLGNVASRLLGHLSKGYRQRVGLAQALIHEPEVLILDEPTNGLDPGQIRDMLAFIRSLGAKRTIVLSTHILSQVLSACHKVVIINEGRVVVEAPLGDLTRDHSLEDVYTQAISGGGVSLADDGARA
jgi:ABC-2 type transport system ATP-binding protein